MSKFDLRDISQRLTAGRDVEAVVFEFLGYLQSVRPDWHASLAFYEISRDALVNVCTRQGNRLVRRDLVVSVDQLPPRLVVRIAAAHDDRKAGFQLLELLCKRNPGAVSQHHIAKQQVE